MKPISLQSLQRTLARHLGLGLILSVSGAFAQTKEAPSSNSLEKDEKPVVLSPFVVITEGDIGYLAQSSVSGSRLNTNLGDLAVPTTAFTQEFLADAFYTACSIRTSGVTTMNSNITTNIHSCYRLSSESVQETLLLLLGKLPARQSCVRLVCAEGAPAPRVGKCYGSGNTSACESPIIQVKSMNRMRLIVAILLIGVVRPMFADDRIGLLAVPTTTLFSDMFDRETLGDGWQATVRSFAIKDGVMTGGMRDDATHPAIVKVSTNFRDIVLRFSFRFDGAKSFNIVFNDINEKSVHSGHVARMTVSPKWLTLTDDKTGLMSLEWVNKRNDPKFKEQVDIVRKEKSRPFPFDWQQGRWYTLVMEVVGEEVLVSIDGRPTGYFRSPGFGQPTKTSFHFSISGRDLSVDNITAWKAEANPSWIQRRDGILEALKK